MREAVEAATAALASARLPVATRLDLLDLRAESYFAQGDVAAAEADAAAMARRSPNRSAAFLAQALNRRAASRRKRRIATCGGHRRGSARRGAAKSAAEARGARVCFVSPKRCSDIGKTGEVRIGRAGRCACSRKLGDPAGEGRAWQGVGAARNGQGRAADANAAAHKALALAERAATLSAWVARRTCWRSTSRTSALRIRLLQNARAAYTPRSHSSHRPASRTTSAAPICNSGCIGAPDACSGLPSTSIGKAACHRARPATWNLAETEMGMGNLPEARRYAEASCALWVQGGRCVEGCLPSDLLRPHGPVGRRFCRGAIPLRGRLAHAVQGTDHDTQEIDALIGLAEAELALDHAAAALIATTRATTIHRRRDLAVMDVDPAHLWWLHHRALAANNETRCGAAGAGRRLPFRRPADCRRHRRRPASQFSQQGRRQPAGRHGLAGERAHAQDRPPKRIPHLRGKSSLREPFERLADTGLRLNELRSAAELHEFLIDEAAELSGGERVCWRWRRRRARDWRAR